MYYAAAPADSVNRYGNEGILEKITQQKKAEQMKSGSDAAIHYGALTNAGLALNLNNY